ERRDRSQLKGQLSMPGVKEKRIAHCPKCKKQTAWVYIKGVNTFWLCLVCATREMVPPQQPPDERAIRAKIKATLDEVQETIARAHAAVDRVRTLLHELDESRQLHRAIMERNAEQQPHPRSDQSPSPPLQAATSPPEPPPSAEPPAKNGSA